MHNILVSGDRHRLRQLRLNLADNAIKYNQRSSRVDISLLQSEGLRNLKLKIPARDSRRYCAPASLKATAAQ